LAAQPNHGIYGAPDDKFAAGYAGISADTGAKAVTPATRLSARRSGLTASFHPATSERRPRKRLAVLLFSTVAEDVADEFCPLALDQEQSDQDRDSDGNDHWRKPGRIDFETFDSAEYRDRRRDHAVAVEQRGPDQTDDE
jgi:hypothetical protein